MMRQRFIHLKSLSGVEENNGCCFQECVTLLQHLGDVTDAKYGKSVQSLCIKTGFYTDVFVQNNMMKFYAHGNLENARILFEEIPEPNLVSWTSMMSSYVHEGQYEYMTMVCACFLLCVDLGRDPTSFVFLWHLRLCFLYF